jgi:hypothetical protein
MGRKSRAALAEEKSIKDTLASIIDKVNTVMDNYGKIKDTLHVVIELYKDEELMSLIEKLKSGNKDPQMYILLAAAILKVLKQEMQDDDGVFDYTPPAE